MQRNEHRGLLSFNKFNKNSHPPTNRIAHRSTINVAIMAQKEITITHSIHILSTNSGARTRSRKTWPERGPAPENAPIPGGAEHQIVATGSRWPGAERACCMPPFTASGLPNCGARWWSTGGYVRKFWNYDRFAERIRIFVIETRTGGFRVLFRTVCQWGDTLW